MYGFTRATITLLASGVAGLLIWIATQIDHNSNGEYWGVYGLIAGAGLIMALSQLLGGWTKWGWPRISVSVFLWAFVPAAIVVLWIVVFHQPHHGLGRTHIRRWSNDIGVDSVVKDFGEYLAVLAFGLGLVFGYTFDTTGPATGAEWRRRRAAAVPPEADVIEERPTETAAAPPPEAAPREGPPPE